MEIKLQVDDRWLETINRLSQAIESLSNVTVTQWPDLPQPVQEAIEAPAQNSTSVEQLVEVKQAETKPVETKPISLDDVRSVCTKAVANGLKESVKDAIAKVGAKSISGLKPEDWQRVYLQVSKALEGLNK